MAFNTNTAAASNGTKNESWKAAGFLNLYLPTKGGARRKLGAIALKEGRHNEKAMLDWLNEDPSRVQIILDKLVIEYNPATPADTSGFDLSAE